MAIKRYRADYDTTIVNAFEPNFQTRGTGSNMGMADVMEVFSVYGRVTSASQELSRVLVQFPTTTISSDRTAGTIPASGSVSFYLRLFNAQHSKTVPRDYKLVAAALSQSWQEGVGLDLETYKDVTDGNTGANWLRRGDVGLQQVTRVQFVTDTSANLRSGYTVLYDSYDTKYAYYFTDSGGGSAPSGFTNTVEVDLTGLSDKESYANKYMEVVNSSVAAITASKNVGSEGNNFVRTTNTIGAAVTASYRDGSLDNSELIISTITSGSGMGSWVTVGGTYITSSEHVFTQSFSTGLEDVEIDITPLVEKWVSGTQPNYGIGVHLSAAYEGYFSSSTGQNSGSVIDNPTGATKSYYTKRLFARGSQYFYKRPVIEARWNSSKKDDRGNFYYSSSLAPAADNLNTLYIYNYVRGALTNIPAVGTGSILVSLYSGSSAPTGSKLTLYDGNTNLTGGWVSTGIYSCSVAITAASTPLDPLFDVWHAGGVEYVTGSIVPNVLSAAQTVSKPVYYLNITNMRRDYRSDETARFNLYIRNKNWQPTIYTVANNTAPATTIPSASYRIYRVMDGYEVLPYGTSSNMYTMLSYDVSGNYFDFDMNILEPGYEYAFKFAFYDPALTSWSEQSETFRFRVEDYEY